MRPKIALFVQHPQCSVQSCNGIINSLKSDYDFKLFSKHEFEDDFLSDVDLICFPGGFGDSDSYDVLLRANHGAICKFIADGGRYLGICMGAYWAGSDYLDILDDVNVEQYITQKGTCTRRPHAKNMKVTWEGIPGNMFFYDGATFKGDGKYEIIATYSTGYPMAIMQGKIGLIGCHPESEIHWYESYSWMRGLYHDGKHHKLLLDFVNKLMENGQDGTAAVC